MSKIKIYINIMDYYTTKLGINEFSDPNLVEKIAKEKYNINVVFSPRNNKKYRLYNDYTDKYVDFGEFGYADATLHKDKKRIERFLSRNARWKDAPPLSASWASYNLLWKDVLDYL